MNREELKNWYEEHEIFDKVLETLWESFYDYKRTEPALFLDVFPLERDNVNLDFVKLSYELPLPDLEGETICVYVDIFTDEKCVGWFKELFNIDGTSKDKYFVVEERGE